MAKDALKTRYELKYSEEIQNAILELMQRYNLALNPSLSLTERLKKENPKVMIFRLAKKILNKEGKFQDIIEVLKKDLKMHQKDAEKLAHDIKNRIVPLTDIIEVNDEIKKQQEEADQRKDEYQKEKFKEELLEKIKASAPKQEEPPKPADTKTAGPKKIEISDVDKNAEELKKMREEIEKKKEEEKIKQNTSKDRYREPID